MRFNTLDDWLAWLEQLHPAEIDLGLERIAQVANRLNIQPGTARVITVAGTNGKGSTLAFLECILQQAGYRVAKYTSPHLARFNERICINGEPVDDARICAALAQIELARDNISLTYFEFTTLAALLIFQQANLDIWLLEVGLGGRLDAVNIIDPDCAVITNIGLDHTDWLGNSRAQIGREKAGVLRANRPAVFAGPDMPVSVQQRADELGTCLLRYGRDYDFGPLPQGWVLHDPEGARQELPLPNLKGEHQLQNAAAAIVALQQLQAELPVPEEAIKQGLTNATLRGRFQQVSGTIEHVFDVAHNPAGAEVLAHQLVSMPPKGKTLAVFSALSDKDVPGMVKPLLPLVTHWYLVGNTVNRGQSAEAIAARLTDWQPRCFANAAEAYRAVQQVAEPGDRILVYGSFYLVGELLEVVEKEVQYG